MPENGGLAENWRKRRISGKAHKLIDGQSISLVCGIGGLYNKRKQGLSSEPLL